MNKPIEKNHLEDVGWLEVMLKKHVRENSVAKVIRIEMEPAVAEGDNYASVVTRVKLHCVMGSGRRTVKSVIIKTLPEGELHLKFLEYYSFFKTETKAKHEQHFWERTQRESLKYFSTDQISIVLLANEVYSDILSEMEYLMLEHGDMDDKIWPDYIGHKAYDTIIFNDLQEMNYSVEDRTKMLGKPHAYLAIRNLARFHAMSVLLRKKGIIKADDFAPGFFVSNTKAANRLMKGGLIVLAKVMRENWGSEWFEMADRIADLEGTCCDTLEELRQIDDNKLNVLNHGDFWTSNILFKYSPCAGHDYPIGIRFLDFQMCHWNSYAMDLVHYIYVGIKAELRHEEFEKLIEAYHESLLATFKFYNYNSEKIPSLQDVFDEYNNKIFFGFMMLASIAPITSAPTSDAFNMDTLMSDGDDIIGHNPKIYMFEQYKQYAQKDFKQFLKNGII